jgi:hypothetical protein
MSESKPGSSAGTGLIIGIIVAAVLGVPCFLGLVVFVLGGVLYTRSASPPPTSVPVPVQAMPRMQDSAQKMPEGQPHSVDPVQPLP